MRTECDEAAMRAALDDAAPLYRDAPEAKAVAAAIDRTFAAFIAEVLPAAPAATRALASELVQATLFEVGKQASEGRRTAAQVTAYADAMADMLCAYLRAAQRA